MADTDGFRFQSCVEHQNNQHLLILTKYQLVWEATNKHKVSDNSASDCLLRKLTL